MAAPTTKTRIRRVDLLKDLKVALKKMDADIERYNKAQAALEAEQKAYEKALEEYKTKRAALIRKKGKFATDYYRYENRVILELDEYVIYDTIGRAPQWDDFVKTKVITAPCLNQVEVKRNIYFTQHQLVKEAIWNLEHSDDEHVYQNTYAHVVQFVV